MSSEDSKVRGNQDSGSAMRRDYDSVDDFEHVSHDGSSPEAARVDNLLDTAKPQTNPEKPNSPASIEEDERSESRAVPATPPPSADFEKCEAMARSSDPFQSVQDQQFAGPAIDPKAVSMAFMESERSFAPAPPMFSVEEVKSTPSATLHEDSTKLDEPADKKPELPEERLVEPMDTLAKNNDVKTGTLIQEFEQPMDVPSAFDSKKEKLGDNVDLLGDSYAIQPEKMSKEAEAPKELHSEFLENIESSVLPAPEKSPSIDFLTGDITSKDSKPGNIMDDDSWNIVEHKHEKLEDQLMAPTKPLPPLPKEADVESDRSSNVDKYEMSNDFLIGESTSGARPKSQSGGETGDSEFESEPEPSPAKAPLRPAPKPQESQPKETSRYAAQQPSRRVEDIEIAPKQIFRDMGLDAWFNPDRLNPKVAALIYWRDPKKSGIVFGATLVVLLSLAYFSLISVLAYLSLIVLTGTAAFRIYKTVLQAVQKTSDGHPFKDILEVDLTLPAEKVHEVADVAVAHANAAVSELRRLFLVEDFVDSVKFGVSLWCLTYVGSWFNGMTLIIIGVVALFTLPKVYETNKAQIDQNLALVQGKINELTAKVKAAIPLGKKSEPTKEE